MIPIKDILFAARKIVMSAYLYYRCDLNILPDSEYDTLVNLVTAHWKELPPIFQYQLGSPEELRSSGFHILVTPYSEAGARQWYRDETKQPVLFPVIEVWQKNNEFGCHFARITP